MPQQVRGRTEEVIEYVANSKKFVNLDRSMVYRELYLQLTMGITTVTAITAADINGGDEWAIVRELKFSLNNNDDIRNLSGEELQWINFFQYGAPRRLSALSGGIIAAQTNVTVESTLILPMWMPNSVKPIDTALDSRLLSNVKMTVEWGDISSITTVGDAVLATDPQINVFTLESFGLNGPFNTMRLFQLKFEAVGVQSKFRVELPVGNMYRAFLLNMKDASSDDISGGISSVKLRSGSTVFFDWQAPVIRDSYLQRNGFDLADAPTGFFASSKSDLDGWTYLDLVTDGLVTEAIDTLGFSSLVLELEITTAAQFLTVIPVEVIPLRNAVATGGGT